MARRGHYGAEKRQKELKKKKKREEKMEAKRLKKLEAEGVVLDENGEPVVPEDADTEVDEVEASDEGQDTSDDTTAPPGRSS